MDNDMDGGNRSRSRRSTLLGEVIFAGTDVATGTNGDACIGGTAAAAADSNG